MPHTVLFPALTGLALVLPLAACEGGPPWGVDEEEPATAVRPDFGPAAAYDRRLIFLGPGEALPTAAVFDFGAVSDSVGIRRGVRVRLVDGSDWIPLLDAGWESRPMREPWRIVPHGPLRVVMGDGGEMGSLLVRGEPEVRLEPGSIIAEHSPDAGTQLVLRQGRLSFGIEQVPGILLDAQLGRSVSLSFRAAARRSAYDSAADPAEDTATEPANGVEADSVAAAATPAARPGAEALLLDNSGYYAVFSTSAAGSIAWVHAGERAEVWRGARLEPVEVQPFREAGTDFPVRWRVAAPTEGLTGELTAEAADRAVLGGTGGPRALGYVLVTGWIEDRGARREVYGLVRHVR